MKQFTKIFYITSENMGLFEANTCIFFGHRDLDHIEKKVEGFFKGMDYAGIEYEIISK